jgi:hypothetical protein
MLGPLRPALSGFVEQEWIVSQELDDRRERRRTGLLSILLPVLEAGSPYAQLLGGLFLRQPEREPSSAKMIA